jgi:hypothetical protein
MNLNDPAELSSDVLLQLRVEDEVLRVAQICGNVLYLRDSRTKPAGDAELLITVNGRTEAHAVHLPYGLTEQSNRVQFEEYNRLQPPPRMTNGRILAELALAASDTVCEANGDLVWIAWLSESADSSRAENESLRAILEAKQLELLDSTFANDDHRHASAVVVRAGSVFRVRLRSWLDEARTKVAESLASAH